MPSLRSVTVIIEIHTCAFDPKMIVRAAEPDEYLEIGDMVVKAFKQSQIERTIIEITTSEDPNFQKGDLRIAEVDERIASMMMLIRRPLRIGTAIVNGAIVAPVATHPDYQGKGYCSAVMRDAVQYMKTQGFDLTILDGISWLYPHYGYSPAMVKTELVITPRQGSSSEKTACAPRPFTESDLARMTCIYNSNTAVKTCAEVRSPEMWDWRLGGPNVKLGVYTDEKDEVIGYRALGRDWGNRPFIHEIGVLNDNACEVIFNSLVEAAIQQGLKELFCGIHPTHPFSRFAYWRGAETRIRNGGGTGMARVLNLVSLLTKMSGEFERRYSHSELHDSKCSLMISSSEESALLEINRGQVSLDTAMSYTGYKLNIPLHCLNPLVTGYKGIRELVKDARARVKGGEQALRLIEILFPEGYPSGGYFPLVWE